MGFSRNFLLAGAVSAFFATSVAAQDVALDTVVARVNGTDITVAHVIDVKGKLPEQYQSLDVAVLFDAILGQLVQQTLLSQSVGDDPAWLATSIENERRNLLAGHAINGLIESAITEEALKAAYDARFAGVEPEQEFHAAHILLETQEKAAELTAQVRDGADFAALAAEHSTGPSGPNGGDLGWFGKGMMVPPFENAVTSMKAGDISDPVQTQFGWHVIHLMETRDKPLPTLEEMRPELEGELQNAAIEARIQELETTGSVERLDGDLDLSGVSGLDWK